jgi:hypothetical protein
MGGTSDKTEFPENHRRSSWLAGKTYLLRACLELSTSHLFLALFPGAAGGRRRFPSSLSIPDTTLRAARRPIITKMVRHPAIEARVLARQQTVAPGLTYEEDLALEVVTLVVSAISVFSGLLAFYWFLRMRRSFRHE